MSSVEKTLLTGFSLLPSRYKMCAPRKVFIINCHQTISFFGSEGFGARRHDILHALSVGLNTSEEESLTRLFKASVNWTGDIINVVLISPKSFLFILIIKFESIIIY